jgi:hydrogenase nickel incorporation protein HypA/HybF
MHELSLAKDIIEIINHNVPANEIQNVREIIVKTGQFSGVAAESLKFSFQAITSKTELENAELKIIEVPFRIKCNSCGEVTTNEFGISFCEKCSSGNAEIISGTELEITEIKITEIKPAETEKA